jgi:hypothetical protein
LSISPAAAAAYVYLDERQIDLLRLLGAQRGVAMAALLREAIDRYLEAQGVRRVDEDEWRRRFDALLTERHTIAEKLGLPEEQVERDVFRGDSRGTRGRAAHRS